MRPQHVLLAGLQYDRILARQRQSWASSCNQQRTGAQTPIIPTQKTSQLVSIPGAAECAQNPPLIGGNTSVDDARRHVPAVAVSNVRAKSVTLELTCPRDAVVLIDGRATDAKGIYRDFDLPVPENDHQTITCRVEVLVMRKGLWMVINPETREQFPYKKGGWRPAPLTVTRNDIRSVETPLVVRIDYRSHSVSDLSATQTVSLPSVSAPKSIALAQSNAGSRRP